ncbi:TPA: hypothetical protein U1C91_000584 [Streptococcus suis]|nr:hypothetical protein [Streptococcus suis]HEM3699876.1 hypothetical protein [Streptococcus suis]
MAKFTGTNKNLHLNVYIDQASQNIAGNSSVVNWRITVSRTGAYLTRNEQGDSTLSVTVNGGQVHYSNPRWRTSGEEVQLASGSTTVGHNADGTKSVGISATFHPNNTVHGPISASGSIGLSTIPRASTIGAVSGTIGNSVTINIQRAASGFKHTLRYAWGSKSGTIATNVDTSATWTIPLDFANDIPNSTSGTGTIYVDTYSGSTKIGERSASLSASVPASMIPTLSSISLTDLNTAAQALIPGNTFIQIVSNIRVAFNGATGIHGSTIKGYQAEIVGKNQRTDSNNGSLGPMNWNGTATIRATVTDSRGRTSNPVNVTIVVLEYFAPVISLTAYRTRENPDIIQVLRTVRIAPLTVNGTQKNTLKLTFKVAPLNSNTYTVDNGPASGQWTNISQMINLAANLAGTYSSLTSFHIVGTVEDKFTPNSAAASVSTETNVFAYDKDGRFGVGKTPENGPAGSLDVAGNIYAGGKPIQQHQLTSNDGYITNDYYTDFNTNIKTGIYHKGVNNGVQTPNSPSKVWGILQVYSANNSSQVLQIFTERDSPRRTFMRLRSNSVWYGWEEYVKTDHPMLQEKPLKTLTMGFPYQLNATLTRKGDMVTVTLNRRITNIDTFEYSQMLETIPLGYRPTAEVHMPVFPNVSASTKPASILHLASDGVIRFTNGTAGNHVFTGTITYITNDPYPA